MKSRSIVLAGVSALLLSTLVASADGSVYFRFAPEASPARAPATSLVFEPTTNVLLGGRTVSAPTRYSGGAATIRATDGEIRVCATPDCATGGTWSTNVSVTDGQVVQVRRAGPTAPGQKVVVSTSALGTTSTFEATGTTAVSLGAFGTATGSPGETSSSDLETFRGWVEASITVAGGEYRVCAPSATCGTFTTTPGTIRDGDQVQVQATFAGYGETRTATVSAGGVSSTFTATSRSMDAVPDAFSLGTDAAGVEPTSFTEAPSIPLTGFDEAPISITGVGAQYSLNVEPYTSTSGTARSADTVKVRIAAGTFGETRTATLTVGGVSSSWSVTTRPRDVVPSAISFTTKIDQTPGAEVLSEAQPLVGHDGVNVSVAGAGSTLRVCSTPNCASGEIGSWTTAVNDVPSGRLVQLRTMAGAAGETRTATLTYGALRTTWGVTSRQSEVEGAFASREGFAAKCESWSGKVCVDAQLMALPPSPAWQSPKYAYRDLKSLWSRIWWGDQAAGLAMFCRVATGNPAIVSSTAVSRATSSPFYAIGFTCRQAGGSRGDCKDLNYAGSPTGEVGFQTDGNPPRFDIQCAGF